MENNLPSINPRLGFLKESIDERIKNIDRKRMQYRKKAFNVYMITSVLSAMITIMLGLKIPELSEGVRITALILSTIITVINAFNAFFSNKDLWIANNTARNRFYKLKFDIEYYERGNGSVSTDSMDKFKGDYQDILDELNTTWQSKRINEKK